MKTYSELITLDTYEERFVYLRMVAKIGDRTFGGYRHLNQLLYKNPLWKEVSEQAIIRDRGCDLGVPGYEIYGTINVHHINPITIDDVLNGNPCIYDLENLITTDADKTHKPLHYGGKPLYSDPVVERTPFDTCPWKNKI